MERIKDSKGITLIALIVTIIVVTIIVGATMATLTQDNGVLRQTNVAKVAQIEATAREQVQMACAAIRLAIAEASARDNSYKANEHVEEIQHVLLRTIKADTKEIEEEGWIEGTLDISTCKFEIRYEGDDYKNACNYNDAKITYTITLGQKTIEFTYEATGLKDSTGNDVNIDVGNMGGNNTENLALNEWGFYTNMIYSTEKDANGVQYHFVPSGLFQDTYAIVCIFKDTVDNKGIPNDVPFIDSTYDYKKITDNATGNEYIISDDGTEIETEYGIAKCTFKEYNRHVYFNEYYYTESDIFLSSRFSFGTPIVFKENGKLYLTDDTEYTEEEDGSISYYWVVDKLPVIEVPNGGLLIFSMDGKRTYPVMDMNANGQMLIEPDVYYDIQFETTLSEGYLVDEVLIGDYVDIGIEYTNVGDYYSSDIYGRITLKDYSNTSGPTGWRVLSKSGSGETGKVTLVSAGIPLSYYHPKEGQASLSISNLSNLSTTLIEGNSGTGTMGFIVSGFPNSTMELSSVWAINNKINGSTARAMTRSDLETAYAAITGVTTNISQLLPYSRLFNTSKMQETANNAGKIMSHKAIDLLGTGNVYWLGGTTDSENSMYAVTTSGSANLTSNSTEGVRVVVELNSGIIVTTGDINNKGATLEKAYIVK